MSVRLVATKDIASEPQCAFSAKKGDVIEVEKREWDSKRRIYRIQTGHGTKFDIEGFVEAGKNVQIAKGGNQMKVLCLCQKGNSRSVVLAWLLKKKFGHETLAAGMTTTSRKTRDMLYQWADRIILVVPRYQHWVPEEYRDKLRVIDAGGDPFKGHDEALLERYAVQFDAMDIVAPRDET